MYEQTLLTVSRDIALVPHTIYGSTFLRSYSTAQKAEEKKQFNSHN
jgi:hypothetical protein